MDATSANRLVAIGMFFGMVVALAFAFFSLTGGFRSIGLPGASLKYADDTAGPAAPPRPARPRVFHAPDLSGPQEPFRPQTFAEKAYYAAIEKADELDARNQARRAERQKVIDFLASDLGKELLAAKELARAGKLEEAKQAFDKLIGEMTELDAELRTHILKSAVAVYQQTKDRAGLKAMLKRYLSLEEEELSRTDLEPRRKAVASEMLDHVQDALKVLDAEK